MKRILVGMILIAGCIVPMSAQDTGSEKVFADERVKKDLSLSEKEIKELQELWGNTNREIQVANADRNIKASELKRLLVEKNVDMNAVKKTLREAMELEYKVRLMQIERILQTKKILGEERWARLQTYMRRLRGRKRMPNDGMPENRRSPQGMSPRGGRK